MTGILTKRPAWILNVLYERYVESKIPTFEDPTDLALWSLAGAYFTYCFVVSVCRNEGLLGDLNVKEPLRSRHQLSHFG